MFKRLLLIFLYAVTTNAFVTQNAVATLLLPIKEESTKTHVKGEELPDETSLEAVFKNLKKINATLKSPVRLTPKQDSLELNPECFLKLKRFEGNPRLLKRDIELVNVIENKEKFEVTAKNEDKSVEAIEVISPSASATLSDLRRICHEFDFEVVPYNDIEEGSYQGISEESNAVL